MGTVVSPSTVWLADGAGLYSVLYPPESGSGSSGSPGSGGKGAARTPVTVVLLHGWTLDNRLWRQQIADLPSRLGALGLGPVRLLAFDLRGHGRSSATSGTDATLEQLGDDLAEVLTQLVPHGPVVLVGHSLGGMAIMEYAQRHAAAFAARTVGVVLVSTSAEGSSRTSYGLSPRLARVMRILEIQGAGLLARSGAWRPHRRLMPLLSPGVRWLVFGHRVDTSWVALTASMVGNAPLCAIGGFRPSVDLHHRVETLAAMRGLPVAVLVGSLDRLTPPACAATIAGELPAAELITCEDAGHMLPIERPDAVTDAIVGVLRRAARTTRMVRQRSDPAGAAAAGMTHTGMTSAGTGGAGTGGGTGGAAAKIGEADLGAKVGPETAAGPAATGPGAAAGPAAKIGPAAMRKSVRRDTPAATSTPATRRSVTPTATPATRRSVTPTATPTTRRSVTSTATPATRRSVTPTATPTTRRSVTPTATPTTRRSVTPTATPPTRRSAQHDSPSNPVPGPGDAEVRAAA